MTPRPKLAVLVPLAVLLVAVPAAYSRAARPSPSEMATGKKLYRKYCGQCHALNEALAAGFGGDKNLGTDGGPSFNNLNIPYNVNIAAVYESFGGHERVVKKMKWQEVSDVSLFVAAATKNHPPGLRQSYG